MDIIWSNTYDLKPSNATNKTSNNPLGSLLDDKFVKKLNPRRYAYYKKFSRILNDPEKIRKFMYTLKNISEDVDEKNKKVKKLIKLHEDLSTVNINSPDYKNLKLNKIKDLNTKVLEILKNKTDSDFSDTSKNTKDDIMKDIVSLYSPTTTTQTGGSNIEYLNNYSRKIEDIIDNKKESDDTKLAKYKNILSEIETVIEPNKSINITKEDKIVFIVFTFILRIITLTLTNWALNNNMINTFQNLVIFYSIVYLLILLIFTMLVNITYKYNINSVNSGTTGFSNMANLFYYFYLVPGAGLIRNSRILAHSIIIVMFMFVPFALKSKNDNNDKIDYDYVKKKKFKELLDKYTFVVWIFTSIIAINY